MHTGEFVTLGAASRFYQNSMPLPERIGMPDVDFDFADDRREEVIRYTAEKYGRDRVAQIGTFGTLGAKAAIRDVARGLGLSFGEGDRVSRLVPAAPHMTIDKAMEESP